MGTDYSLHRLRAPLPKPSVSVDELPEEALRDFGAQAEVVRRLVATGELEAPGEAASAVERRIRQRSVAMARERGAPDPPVHLSLIARTLPGRRLPVTVWGDPVTHFSVSHAAPWELLPLLELLADGQPMTVFDPQRGRYLDTTSLMPEPPARTDAAARLSPPSAGERWCVEVEGHLEAHAPPIVAEGRLVVAGFGRILSLDARTGEVAWAASWSRGTPLLRRVGAQLVVAGDHPRVFGLDARTGAVRWEREVDGRVCAPPVLTEADGVALGTEGAQVLHLSGVDGATRWERRFERGLLTAPVHAEGHVVLADRGGTVTVLEVDSGRLAATRRFEAAPAHGGLEIPSMIDLAPLPGGVAAKLPWQLTRLSLPSLEPTVWLDRPDRAMSWAGCCFAPLGDELLALGLATESRRCVLGLDARTGALLWEAPVDRPASPPARIDGERWAVGLGCRSYPEGGEGDRGVGVMILGLRDGASLERRWLETGVHEPAAVAVGDGRLYLVTPRAIRALLL